MVHNIFFTQYETIMKISTAIKKVEQLAVNNQTNNQTNKATSQSTTHTATISAESLNTKKS